MPIVGYSLEEIEARRQELEVAVKKRFSRTADEVAVIGIDRNPSTNFSQFPNFPLWPFCMGILVLSDADFLAALERYRASFI